MNPLTISLRLSPTGGDVAHSPDLTTIKSMRTKSMLLLLVHGYNNTRTEAQASFSAFLDIQRELYGAQTLNELPSDRDLAQVFWPGDGWGVLGPAYYSAALGHAEEAAPVLADVLEQLGRSSGGALTVEFVGHSLGCRLVLETMKQLERSTAVTLGRVAFMAAAVPVQFLEDVNHSPSLVDEFQWMSEHGALSLYSPDDLVLAGAFPAGETISLSEHSFFPLALGHNAWQGSQPQDRFEQDIVAGAGHSDYWGQREATRASCATVASEKVRNFLQLPIGERQLQGRNSPERMTDERTTDRRMVDAREISVRQT